MYLQAVRIGDGRLWLDVRQDDSDGPSGTMQGKKVRFYRDRSIVAPDSGRIGDV